MARNLLKMYPSDLDDSFPEECLHLQAYLKENEAFYEAEKSVVCSSNMKTNKITKGKGSADAKLGTKAYRLLKHLKSLKVESIFPNVEVALRIFSSMAVTNCSGERSFSALGRVKNYLRSTLSQDKVKALALLFIESEFVQHITFDKIIEQFARSKPRKKSFT